MTLKERWASIKFKDNIILLDFFVALLLGIGVGIGSADIVLGFLAFLSGFLLFGDFQTKTSYWLSLFTGSLLSFVVLTIIWRESLWWSVVGGIIGVIVGFMIGAPLLAFKYYKQSQKAGE